MGTNPKELDYTMILCKDGCHLIRIECNLLVPHTLKEIAAVWLGDSPHYYTEIELFFRGILMRRIKTTDLDKIKLIELP